MTHVVLRCNASPDRGVGHLVRAISVADAARAAGYTAALAGAITSDLGHELVTAAGLDVVDASDDLGILAAEQGATVVHVDDYAVGADACTRVHDAGALLSSMEDGTFGRRPADVVIDSTIGAEHGTRPTDGSGLVLLGISYAPMRAQVLAARQRRASTPPESGADVLVVMGGTDATRATATVAAICRRAAGVGRIAVIAPERDWEAVRRAAGEGAELVAPTPDFVDRLTDVDLVVSAAGTTSWELACIGVPSMLVAVVENQLAGYQAAIAQGIARGLGRLSEVRDDPGAAVARLEAALAALSAGDSWAPTGLTKVDGRGAERIVAAWADSLAKRTQHPTTVTARPAASRDSLLLLRWRNDPATRAVSRSTELVAWPDHADWYQRVLADPAREFYVVEHLSTPVGTVRFDERTVGEWEVSITLAPEARGRGLARQVLAAGEAAFTDRHGNVTLVAVIRPDNAASQRLFRGAGFTPDVARRSEGFDLLVRAR